MLQKFQNFMITRTMTMSSAKLKTMMTTTMKIWRKSFTYLVKKRMIYCMNLFSGKNLLMEETELKDKLRNTRE